MKLRPYQKYKDSGVEWLGEIPEEWKIKRLKYIAHIEMGQSPYSSFYNKDGIGVPFLQGNADFKGLYPQPQVWTTDDNKYSQKNDILISVRAPVGELNISNDRYSIGRGLAALRFNKKSNFKYFYYLFIKSKNYFDSVSTGTTYSAISTNDIKNIIIAVPPIDQQTKIGKYLDHKTSKIDELIKKNEKLIELLKEKRQAIISQAVTKGLPAAAAAQAGLDPNVKMKDSGIEWLGKIPEGWDLRRLKYVCSTYAEYGLNIAAENYQIDGIRFIRTTDIDDYGNLKEEGVYLDELLSKHYVLNDGDILISRSGTIGRTFLFDSKKNEKATYAGYLVRFCLDRKETVPKYIFYFAQSHSFFEWLKTQLIETTIGNVNGQKYANLLVTLPQKEHQTQIANYLDQKTSKIDGLIKKIKSQIENLKEYRQTLISNVVTGKVRIFDTA